ncbi:MAG: DUF1819 family protein [Psychromonas sp.]|nr:DUF1819 family protein [Psychromonas sp.]
MFAATLINSTILADFMSSVFVDAKRMFRKNIDSTDWQVFWEERCRLFPALEKLRNHPPIKYHKSPSKY